MHFLLGLIKVAEVPNLLRALGYYPSNADITEIYGELTYSDYATSGEETTHVSLEQFIRLFINHRPVAGVAISQISDAFKAVEAAVKDNRGLTWSSLESLLSTKGEPISAEEMHTLIATLLGDRGAKLLLQQSGSQITSLDFAGDILGFEDVPSY